MADGPVSPARPPFTAVVAAWCGERATAACLGSLEVQARGLEVVVATNEAAEAVARLSRRFPAFVMLRAPPEASVFELRALGAANATGDLVALTEDHVTVAPGWTQALRQAHAAGHGLLAGAVENGNAERAYDWALYFCEYGLCMPPLPEGPAVSVSGLNVAYHRDLLASCRRVWQHALMENEVNDALRAAAVGPWSVPAAIVRSHLPFTPRQACAHLFDGGRHHGSYRARRSRLVSRFARVLASPLVLLVLVSRRVRRVLARNRSLLPQLLSAMPWILVLDGAWTAGEAWGGLAPRGAR
jgi:hypothetical protein